MIPNVFEIQLAKRAQAEEFFTGQICKFLCSETDLQVPIERLLSASPKLRHLLVGLGGLISYQHMGSMLLKCRGGCSCPSLNHNMHHDQVAITLLFASSQPSAVSYGSSV